MSATDLKKWMEINDKTVIDIAAATKLYPHTVKRFLVGKNTNASTRETLRKYVQEHSKSSTGPEAA